MQEVKLPLFGSVRIETSDLVPRGMLIVCRDEEVLNIIPASSFEFLAKFGLCPEIPIEANRFIVDQAQYDEITKAAIDASA